MNIIINDYLFFDFYSLIPSLATNDFSSFHFQVPGYQS